MDKYTAAQVMAIQIAQMNLLTELVVLLPPDQRSLLRTRLQDHANKAGKIDEFEPEFSEYLATHYSLLDKLLEPKSV